MPNLPDAVAREAYSHEVSSAGFWPGGGAIDYPAFYSYAYPAPEGFAEAKVAPAEAFYSKELGEFVLPYDAVRTRAEPDARADGFPADDLRRGGRPRAWDRAALECALGGAAPRAAGVTGDAAGRRGNAGTAWRSHLRVPVSRLGWRIVRHVPPPKEPEAAEEQCMIASAVASARDRSASRPGAHRRMHVRRRPRCPSARHNRGHAAT